MSTRCQIGFYEVKGMDIKKHTALIYRHSDGYPGKLGRTDPGVIPDIVPYLEKFIKVRGGRDMEYMSAQLLADLIIYHRKTYKGMEYIGHGISDDFHGDIEYFYYIYPEGIIVYEVTDRFSNNPKVDGKIVQAYKLEKGKYIIDKETTCAIKI